mgnify:CR=1 FL=1
MGKRGEDVFSFYRIISLYVDTFNMVALEVLTKTFSFEKPPKEIKIRNKRDYGWTKRKQAIRAKHKKLVSRRHQGLKFKAKKLPSIRKLKEKADLTFSKWIRERDHNKCVTANRKCKGPIQCSHLIRRGKTATRYSEINCHAQCSYHNYLHREYPQEYTAWFVAKYGGNEFVKLELKSQKITQLKRQDFMDIIKRYESNTTKD